MRTRFWRTIWYSRRPEEGWLPLALLLVLVGCLVGAVLEAGWVPEERVVIPAALAGLLLGIVLAKRPLPTLPAWLFLILYGFVVNVLWLGQLIPPLNVLAQGWWPLNRFWYINGGLFVDRTASWFQALFSGGRSEETVVFALGMGMLAWLLAAYAAWSTYRQHRPLHGLTAMGFVLALNAYFGDAQVFWVSAFVGLAALLAALAHYRFLEMGWQETTVDYSLEIRIDLALHASAIALVLVMASLILPAFSISKLVEFFAQQPAVQELEQTWDRVLGGVEPPSGTGLGSGPGGPGGAGILPRSFLLDNAPELTETVVMTAVVTTPDGTPLTPIEMDGLHWRGLSYEGYTGRGWTISEERVEELSAFEPISLPPQSRQSQLRQTVNWLFDSRSIRYTLGYPMQFDEPVTVRWRGVADFVRAQGSQSTYSATTTRTAAGPDQLRQAVLADVPPAVLARYTALPDTTPPRVGELAQDVTRAFATPYDQARAIEQFLRQYTYSLEVDLPQAGADVVDYFLFEAQAGYCDFYASAMVVMARSVGLPARLAVGFLAQTPDELGVQVVRQIHSHSWAEVYFAGYGWVEFEPTAGFAVARGTAVAESPSAPAEPVNPFADAETANPLPLPQRDASPPSPGRWLWRGSAVALLTVLLVGAWLWQSRRTKVADVPAVYGRFQQQAFKLGTPAEPSQTPREFAAQFFRHLEPFTRQPRLARWVHILRDPVATITAIFEQWQYAPPREEEETAVVSQLWAKIRRPLRLLRLVRHLRRR